MNNCVEENDVVLKDEQDVVVVVQATLATGSAATTAAKASVNLIVGCKCIFPFALKRTKESGLKIKYMRCWLNTRVS